MENKSYSYGIKMVGLILHMFFTVVLTMSICVLGFMIDKNIFEVTDIGTSNFLKSGYYTQCIQDKCDHLAEYLHLLRLGDGRSVEDNKRYLQYTDEFKSEDTNFCFWYKIDGKWYTNQPDMRFLPLETIFLAVRSILPQAKLFTRCQVGSLPESRNRGGAPRSRVIAQIGLPML